MTKEGTALRLMTVSLLSLLTGAAAATVAAPSARADGTKDRLVAEDFLRQRQAEMEDAELELALARLDAQEEVQLFALLTEQHDGHLISDGTFERARLRHVWTEGEQPHAQADVDQARARVALARALRDDARQPANNPAALTRAFEQAWAAACATYAAAGAKAEAELAWRSAELRAGESLYADGVVGTKDVVLRHTEVERATARLQSWRTRERACRDSAQLD
jgi:hypothetical protein